VVQRAILVIAVAACTVLRGSSQERPLVSFSEYSVRASAVRVVHPKYPPTAFRQHQTGVAVAQVYVNDDGAVEKVDLLQAPSEAIAASVREALKQWKFGPELVTPGGEFTGKMTYYFVISRGKPAVFEPKYAPYIGRW